MEEIKITYRFVLTDKEIEIPIQLDGESLLLKRDEPEREFPQWVDLEYHCCENCTLSRNEHSHCPVMVNLYEVQKEFDTIMSYEEVSLEVLTKDRTVIQNTTAQRALSSLVGLIMATSGCPHTQFFKPMARFHLPLANKDETLFRATSMYLLAQYIRAHKGLEPDFELTGLSDIYHNMETVNAAIAERLREASKADATANAVILLDLFAKIVPLVIDKSLEKIEYLFDSYIN